MMVKLLSGAVTEFVSFSPVQTAVIIENPQVRDAFLESFRFQELRRRQRKCLRITREERESVCVCVCVRACVRICIPMSYVYG
jgi:hypothetical protein